MTRFIMAAALLVLGLGACSGGGDDAASNTSRPAVHATTSTTSTTTTKARPGATTTSTTGRPRGVPASTNPCAAAGITVDGCADFGDIEVATDGANITVRSPQGQRTYTPDQAASALGAKSSDQGIAVQLPDNVLFDFNSVALHSAAREKLALVAGLAKRSPDAKVDIGGYTDAVGSADFNQRLSEARAGVVREALAILGIDRGRVTARGYGTARPVAPNTNPDGSDNPAGRARNRRVEILLAGAHV
jgi:photosystem I P700 chlorophyll a apoprotein A2